MILAKLRLPILESEHLRLTPLAETDAPVVFPLMGDPDAMAYWDIPEIDDPDVVSTIVVNQVEAMRAGLALHWVVRDLRDGVARGVCDLLDLQSRSRRAELRFTLDRGAWDSGYPREAIRTVAVYAAAAGLRRLLTRTHLGDRPSDKVLEDLGFREDGLRRGQSLRIGQRRDCRIFELAL
jgi:[ribosomal protein S5]-alanine N-acetyltransferase